MGSSPLTRGKLRRRSRRPPPSRLIPAHAGKTWKQTRRRPSDSAHPRSRGENSMIGPAACCRVGSSPLTRGKRAWALRWFPTRRLIPAHAGKTSPPSSGRPLSRAHPRSRGENTTGEELMARTGGSSPLTRGKLDFEAGRRGGGGLIPAHAGKTILFFLVFGFCEAHPRSRGENVQRGQSHASRAGSSPLTRGKRLFGLSGAFTGWLIPAHAGKTFFQEPQEVGVGAHPRSRGENQQAYQSRARDIGSSPLTRGKHVLRDRIGVRSRLIPAHAGKTPHPHDLHARRRAHPRSRGENARTTHRLQDGGAHPRSRGENHLMRIEWSAVQGSSPLTRGKRRVMRREGLRPGLIPAHAGKTVQGLHQSFHDRAHPRSRGENRIQFSVRL